MLTAFVFSIGKAYSYVYLDARYERVLRMVWSAHRQCLSLLVLMSVGIVQYWLLKLLHEKVRRPGQPSWKGSQGGAF